MGKWRISKVPRSRLCQIPYKVKIITHQNPPLGPFPPHQSCDDPHDLKCRVRTYTMCSRNMTQGSSNDALVEVIWPRDWVTQGTSVKGIGLYPRLQALSELGSCLAAHCTGPYSSHAHSLNPKTLNPRSWGWWLDEEVGEFLMSDEFWLRLGFDTISLPLFGALTLKQPIPPQQLLHCRESYCIPSKP